MNPYRCFRQRIGRGRVAELVCSAVLMLTPCAAVYALTPGSGDDIPRHPDELEFGELEFQVPDASALRHELDNGTAAYVVEDPILPLFTVTARVRIGSFLEPADKVGLASLTGRLMRSGGAGDLDAGAFDERAAFLAADLSSSIGQTSGTARVNCLSSQKDECLDLFFSMMRSPRFDPARLVTEKQNQLEQLRQRNDEPQSLAEREWQWLLYGREHFTSRFETAQSLAAIERDDLIDFHRRFWNPNRMVWSVSGDVDAEEIVDDLNRRLASWSKSEFADVPWPPPAPRFEPKPGVYVVEKDIPQGRVQIGRLTAERADWMAKDQLAAALMNEILGGGGFTSRLVKRIRSDEGLAYSAGSSFSYGEHWPGEFSAGYQSKSETVAYAAALAFEELRRMATSEVSDEELATAKGSLRDSFPGNFDSSSSTAALFALDEMIGRPHAYWETYQERIDGITKADIQAVARKYLDPDQMVFLIVGDWAAIEPGDADGRATMEQFFGGAVSLLPERDPVTLEIVP